jgi:LPS-assembly lipoprotein
MRRGRTLTWRMLLPLALCGLLPACGFHPLYAENSGEPGKVQTGLAEINVALLPERTGQLLRSNLQARLDPNSSGLARRYDLAISYGISGTPIGIQEDSSITRVRLIGTANWTLTAEDAKHSTLATGVARDVDGYNIFDQQFFAMDLENTSVQRRITAAIADQMTQQLAAYFDKQPGS